MKNHIVAKLQLLLMAGVAAFVLGSCKDESSILGLDLYPEDDQPSISSTVVKNLETYVLSEDSVVGDETGANLLGVYNDPTFGITNASFYAHLRTSTNNIDFGVNPQIDSVVLGLGFLRVFGDSSYVHEISIHEVTETIEKDSAYYTNTSFEFDNVQALGTYTGPLYIDPTDTVTLDNGEEVARHLRIKLDNAFGQKILDQSGQPTLDDPESFIEFFKGIHVKTSGSTPAQGAGSVVSYSLTGTLSKVTIYYHTDSEDSLNLDLVISDKSARVNQFRHDFSGNPELQSALADTSTQGRDVFYVKSLAGVRGMIQLPDLTHWADSNIALNNVRLILPVIDNSSDLIEKPDRMTLVRMDGENKSLLLADLQSSESLFGGTFNEDKNEYAFNITQHVHKVIQGDLENQRLGLIINGGAILAKHVILGGRDNPDSAKRIRLEMYYTKP